MRRHSYWRHRVSAIFLLVGITCMLLSPVIGYAAADYSFSVEDVYEAFAQEIVIAEGENDGEGATADVEKGTYVLPTWAKLREVLVDKDKILSLSGDSYKIAINQYNIADAITRGFNKSSEWTKFKTDMESVCTYNVTTRELILTATSTTATRKFDALLEKFDNAMLIASVNAMTDVSKASNDSKFVLIVDNVSDLIIGYVGVIIFHIGRISMTIASLVFVAELLYISVEPLRPLLGFETQPKFFKKLSFRGEELGADSSRVFRIVGLAARQAVQREYEISNMSEVSKNNILVSFLWGKSLYMLAMFGGIALIDAKVWGSLCTSIMSFFLGVL